VLVERTVAARGDGRVVDEDIRTPAVGSNEAEPLLAVEPLHGASSHANSSIKKPRTDAGAVPTVAGLGRFGEGYCEPTCRGASHPDAPRHGKPQVAGPRGAVRQAPGCSCPPPPAPPPWGAVGIWRCSTVVVRPTPKGSGVAISPSSRPRKRNSPSRPSPAASTSMVWPAWIWPYRIFSDRTSSISRWIARRSGRAPRTGS